MIRCACRDFEMSTKDGLPIDWSCTELVDKLKILVSVRYMG